MKEKNILFVHANNYDVGGSDYCLFKIVKELSREIFKPIVLLRINTEIVELYQKNNIEILTHPIVRLQKSFNIFAFMKKFYSIFYTIVIITKIIHKYKVDMIHVNDSLDFLITIIAKLNKIKVVQHIRLNITNNCIRKVVSFFILKFSDVILCTSNATKNYMIKKNSSKVFVVHDWVDMAALEQSKYKKDLYEELKIRNDSYLIGCIGRLEYIKGQHILIDAMSIVNKYYPTCHLILVGGQVKNKEYYQKFLIKKIEKNNLYKVIHILGERKDILSILNQLQFTILPSVVPDSFPGVVLESIFSGTPVIGSKTGGVVEQIENYKTGILFELGNTQELADSICELIRNNDLLQLMKRKCIESKSTKFNKKIIVEQLQKIYSELMEN